MGLPGHRGWEWACIWRGRPKLAPGPPAPLPSTCHLARLTLSSGPGAVAQGWGPPSLPVAGTVSKQGALDLRRLGYSGPPVVSPSLLGATPPPGVLLSCLSLPLAQNPAGQSSRLSHGTSGGVRSTPHAASSRWSSMQLCCRAWSRRSPPSPAGLGVQGSGLGLASSCLSLSPVCAARRGPGSSPCGEDSVPASVSSSPAPVRSGSPNPGARRAEWPYPWGWGILEGLLFPRVEAWAFWERIRFKGTWGSETGLGQPGVNSWAAPPLHQSPEARLGPPGHPLPHLPPTVWPQPLPRQFLKGEI